MRILFAVCLLGVLAGPAVAEAPDGYVQKPVWTQKPSITDFSKAVSRSKASTPVALGVSIAVSVDCIVAGDGSLDACEVVSETPAGCGGADAALRLTPKFRMETRAADGDSTVGRRVRVPIRLISGAKAVTSAEDIARICR
jgi:protein TonB